MVIDSSALVAILLDEPEAEYLMTALAADPLRCMSAFSVLEASVVLYRRKGGDAVAELDALLADLGIEICPSTPLRCGQRALRTSDSAKGCIQLRSILATAAHTLWRTPATSSCSIKATTSPGPISLLLHAFRRPSPLKTELRPLIESIPLRRRSNSAGRDPRTVVDV